MDEQTFINWMYEKEILTEYNEEKAKKIFQAFKLLGDVSNSGCYGNDLKLIHYAFVAGTGHRTLQQSTFRMIISLIEYLATEEFEKQTDGRNVGTHQLSKQIVESCEHMGLAHI